MWYYNSRFCSWCQEFFSEKHCSIVLRHDFLAVAGTESRHDRYPVTLGWSVTTLGLRFAINSCDDTGRQPADRRED
jgi:hypothetical protein